MLNGVRIKRQPIKIIDPYDTLLVIPKGNLLIFYLVHTETLSHAMEVII